MELGEEGVRACIISYEEGGRNTTFAKSRTLSTVYYNLLSSRLALGQPVRGKRSAPKQSSSTVSRKGCSPRQGNVFYFLLCNSATTREESGGGVLITPEEGVSSPRVVGGIPELCCVARQRHPGSPASLSLAGFHFIHSVVLPGIKHTLRPLTPSLPI